MKFSIIWRTSVKALVKNKRRSILTMIGIIIGISSVITIMSLGRGFQKETIKNLSSNDKDEITVNVNFIPEEVNLGANNLVYFQEQDLRNIKEIEGVKKVSIAEDTSDTQQVELMIKGKKKNEQLKLVKGKSTNVDYGRSLKASDSQTTNKVAVIDSILAKELYTTEKSALNSAVDIQGELFTIVGIVSVSDTDNLFSMNPNIEIPKQSYEFYFPKSSNGESIQVTVEPTSTPDKVTTKVLKELRKSGSMRERGEYQVFDMAALTEGIGKILSGLTLFISAIAGISLFIAGVGVMNMMYISVSERTKEIGIRRALGATEKVIQVQFLLEGVTITLIGGLIGYLLGIVSAFIISLFLPFSISVDVFTVLLATGISVLIGIVFSVMPASAAARKDLIDILR
ncbi:permease family protein [Carnobacterium maltaromaticum LMA28]|uniref:Permease family protein n=1 Tax=Carnobacterium maltaromaticum LMA28 TaxID=1234679 RepID=K8EIV3_CARML|nr:ABC transporter permease [Carnobacterium maltaromaticum]CCO11778.2 permease family protein [Carnobacterium maltaromaticum LMA28]